MLQINHVQQRILVTLVCVLLIMDCCCILECLENSQAKRVLYHYRRFDYRKKKPQEQSFKKYSRACDQREKCRQLVGAARTTCGRQCLSEYCFNELYGIDELEDGEIDVRLHSFKGCFFEEQYNMTKIKRIN
ncbi:PREDICTED: uncharacterized protein LOC106814146 [Priapulus caudatus]|uniref:Uncharacterized protein LOC106814146 n=1 Tax=Priapulus caudatus TaxID=37621 RepID=A0ABM1EP02_PRICU|nr:PREDICTED: uncharacterized protein LOC106814146 [Priapulus caudatus]